MNNHETFRIFALSRTGHAWWDFRVGRIAFKVGIGVVRLGVPHFRWELKVGIGVIRLGVLHFRWEFKVGS